DLGGWRTSEGEYAIRGGNDRGACDRGTCAAGRRGLNRRRPRLKPVTGIDDGARRAERDVGRADHERHRTVRVRKTHANLVAAEARAHDHSQRLVGEPNVARRLEAGGPGANPFLLARSEEPAFILTRSSNP